MIKHNHSILWIIVSCFLMFIGLHLWTIYYLPKYDSVSTGDIILLITVGFIFWYAWETRQMRRQMVYQTKIHATPLIHVYIKSGSPTGALRYKCWAKNVGEGAAIKIELSVLGPFQGETPIFKQIETLSKGDELALDIVKIKTTSGGETSGERPETNFLQNLKVFSQEGEVSFKLRFRNILNDPIEYELTFKDGEFITKVS